MRHPHHRVASDPGTCRSSSSRACLCCVCMLCAWRASAWNACAVSVRTAWLFGSSFEPLQFLGMLPWARPVHLPRHLPSARRPPGRGYRSSCFGAGVRHTMRGASGGMRWHVRQSAAGSRAGSLGSPCGAASAIDGGGGQGVGDDAPLCTGACCVRLFCLSRAAEMRCQRGHAHSHCNVHTAQHACAGVVQTTIVVCTGGCDRGISVYDGACASRSPWEKARSASTQSHDLRGIGPPAQSSACYNQSCASKPSI